MRSRKKDFFLCSFNLPSSGPTTCSGIIIKTFVYSGSSPSTPFRRSYLIQIPFLLGQKRPSGHTFVGLKTPAFAEIRGNMNVLAKWNAHAHMQTKRIPCGEESGIMRRNRRSGFVSTQPQDQVASLFMRANHRLNIFSLQSLSTWKDETFEIPLRNTAKVHCKIQIKRYTEKV